MNWQFVVSMPHMKGIAIDAYTQFRSGGFVVMFVHERF